MRCSECRPRGRSREVDKRVVAVVFGKHFHLSGYPAWQMHRAEIYHRRDLRGFDREGLREILRRYANVSKRHGR